MATTYARIYVITNSIVGTGGDLTKQQFISNLRGRRIKELKVRGDGSDINDYMKEETIERLIELTRDLGLTQVSDDDKLQLTEKGITSNKSEEDYKRILKSSIKSLLHKMKCPMEKIIEAIKKIRLPDVPDTDTIFSKLKITDPKLTRTELRRLLFLYACAEGIKRRMRVHYEE